MQSFQSLGLREEILRVLPEIGLHQPTAIQSQAIPQLLTGTIDLIGLAQTGTGKTAAFGLPLLEQIDQSQAHCQALILVPTRELCLQIQNQLIAFSAQMPGVRSLPIYGGAPMNGQLHGLKQKPQILVATPGRLMDFMDRKKIKLDQVRYVVLDEADEMLHMGFVDDINTILSQMPTERHIWLFSATMPPPIRQIVNQYMHEPVEIRIDEGQRTNQNIEHQYVVVQSKDKADALCRFMNLDPQMRGIVFCRTKAGTQELADYLIGQGFAVDSLHGDLTQNQREHVMKHFRSETTRMVVATDVAARGIDVQDLHYVFHYDLPDDAAYYTHRSGRTARAGKSGISLCLITPRELNRVKQLDRQLKLKMQKVQVPQNETIQEKALENWAQSIWKEEPHLPASVRDQALGWFFTMSKEEMIERLVSMYLRQHAPKGDHRDLNVDVAETTGKSSRATRLYLNAGKMDGLNKQSMLHLLTHQTGVSGKAIGHIEIRQKHSTIEVSSADLDALIIELQGRSYNGRRLFPKEDSIKAQMPHQRKHIHKIKQQSGKKKRKSKSAK